MKKRIKCYIYTRVSTSMQVDGYSLDAQKDKLRKYAEYEDMTIVGEYSDEGFSGKNIQGRLEFQRMLSDIQEGKDDISFVLVFKLSRFGRNAADVLNSLQLMQDFGVNLICVEDGIDSSKDSGKLMISVLSAVAEIERENIRTQTMAGREQKAREGKWNGGFAPYGYKLVDGKLKIAEDEAEVIRIIYDRYIHNDPHFDRKILDLQRRYDEQYGRIEEIETHIDEVKSQIQSIRQEKISGENIYQLLLAFDEVYGAATEIEQKEFMRAFIERIDLYPEKQKDGNRIRNMVFNFPVPVNGQEVKELPLESGTMLETVAVLSRKSASKSFIPVSISPKDMGLSEEKDQPTYANIRDYVQKTHGMKVSSLYVAQMKAECGLETQADRSGDKKQPKCPPEKREAILDAFRHFGLIGEDETEK